MAQDLGRHFLLGEIVLKTLSVPKINLFSYTYPNFPFINLHWLSEVIFYLVFKLSGFNGLLLFSTFIALAAFSVIFFRAYKNNLIPITISSMLYFGILFERTDIRPELFSFLFLSIFIVALYQYRTKFTKLVFLLPLIELLWVNMHIYFAIGVSVIGIFLIDCVFSERKEILGFFKNQGKFPKKTLYLLIVLILSIIAANINPNGIKGFLYPLYFSQNYGYPIEENQNILFLWQLFQLPSIIYFTVASVLLFVFMFINISKSRLVDWLLSIFFVAISAWAIRDFPLFVFGTFMAFVYNFSFVYKKIPEKLSKILYFFVLLALIYQIFSVSTTTAVGFGVDPGAKNGADFFLKNNLKGPLFNNFDIGSYLDYRFYPKERVFVDSRPGEYPASFWQNVFIPMMENPAIFKQQDEKYHFNTIFISYLDQTPWANQFLADIVNNNEWKPVYLDDYVFILVKNNSENAAVIKKFTFNKNDVRISNLDLKNKDSLLHLAIFSSKVGWIDLGQKVLTQLVTVDPNNCNGLYGLTLILQGKNDPMASIYQARWENSCR